MIFFVLIFAFVSAALIFLAIPLFRQNALESEGFDELDYRKQLFKDQLSELEENVIENEISSELKDELGSIFLSEQEQKNEVADENKSGDRVILSGFVGVAFLMALFGACSYWVVGGHNLIEIKGAEQLLALDPEQEKLALEDWTKRLVQRVERREGDGKSWYLLGHAHLKVGSYGKASDAFSQANRLIRSDLNVLSYWLQARYLESGEVDSKSQEIIKDILELDPGHVAAREVLGFSALKNGEMLTAISELSKAISASTNSIRQRVLAALVAEARNKLSADIGGVFITINSKNKIPDKSTIFVIARPVGGGMPYAVVKRPALMIPFSVVLDDLVSMQSARLLSLAESFEVVIRVSRSGAISGRTDNPAWVSEQLSGAAYGERITIVAEIDGAGAKPAG